MNYILYIFIATFLLTGCAAGHQDFVDSQNYWIGKKEIRTESFKWKNSGKLIRADFLLAGQGLTHISNDDKGNLIYHYSIDEILPTFGNKKLIGKCLIFYVVNPDSMIRISWGFDKGGNPLSCRTWS